MAEAELEASRERERELIRALQENTRKLEELKKKYGSAEATPKEEMKPVADERFAILARLEGNTLGLREQGLTASATSLQASRELDDWKASKS